MHQDGPLPRARRDGLLEETLREKLLLYDQNSHTAHCLSPIAACVWRHCDGERDVTELAELRRTNNDLVVDALHELREKDLLDAEPALTESAVPGVSGREAIVRAARYGAAAAGASLIVSATAATPAMAASEPNCCQCFNTNSEKCGCTTKMTDKECQEFCEKLSACSGSLTTSNLTGTECSKTNA